MTSRLHGLNSAGMETIQPSLAEVAALVGNPARANMLTALLNGRALTATELACAAGVAPQTASGHLARLTEGRLLTAAKQGRHIYHRLASPLIGRMLESIMAVAADGPPRYQPRWRGGDALRNARTCYDHLAGRLGVDLADALVGRDHVTLSEDGGIVTTAGEEFLRGFGIELHAAGARRRVFCRPCLDWSERRTHLAGAVGAALAARSFELGWITRIRDTRAVFVTETGKRGFSDTFGITLPA
ncbi:MAG TPA: helix-turn-helix transcriptional regulator [Stellaceae bacterium]|jgi:DNA-binding transcriptional ArsR family regulator